MASPIATVGTILDHFKEITDRITERCQRQHRPCSERVAAYTLRAVTLDPACGLAFEAPLTAKQMQSIVEMTAARVLHPDSPAMETIKMQAAIDGIQVQTEGQLRDAAAKLTADTDAAIEKVVEFAARLRSDGQLPTIYKLVFDVLSLHAGTPALDRQTEREMAAAMQSALPKDRVLMFAQMPVDEKRQQLATLIDITLGIRLLNRYLGKGGAAIPDVPDQVFAAITALTADLDAERIEVDGMCQRYATLLRVEFARPGTIASPQARLQDEARNRQQYASFIGRLLQDVQQTGALAQDAVAHIDTEIEQLKSMVNSRTSLPKRAVFPRFAALGRLWRALQVEQAHLAAKRTVLSELVKFKCNFTVNIASDDLHLLQDQARVEQILSSSSSSSSAQAGSAPAGAAEPQAASAGEAVHAPDLVQASQEHRIEFDGYCPWTIAWRDGLLLPGDPHLGLVHYRQKYYACVDQAALSAFMASPETHLGKVHAKVRSATELIHLLHLDDQYPNVTGLDESDRNDVTLYGERNATADVGTETPVHFVEEAIDKSYAWNHWDRRRQALQLVALRRKSTSSTQTTSTYSKRSAETQKYDSNKDAATQTGIDRQTNTLVRRAYVQGLRGEAQRDVRFVTMHM
ncbi:unnamed protein product (mitochondrion) [Plasmodiophora brassicae]|uniref:Cilia- and flagella-associated protein 206 n=1 Tax=Plasmodiophora brassicae TaxID=37360 RepID=A0A0G4ISI7_PLABS|nr:hypothetical protein PBRA_006432 [Plasmodiophora brassicae]SPQ94404.1 unnamed protein product [Plasmodiophora brassicae]